MLDSALRSTLEDRFREKDGKTDMNEKIFKIGGPLGNSGPKIDLGYQLQVFDKPECNAMHGVFEIRNYFAHNLKAELEQPNDKLQQSLNKLRLHVGETHYPVPHPKMPSRHPIGTITNNRSLFIENLKISLLKLMFDISNHYPNTNIPYSYFRRETS